MQITCVLCAGTAGWPGTAPSQRYLSRARTRPAPIDYVSATQECGGNLQRQSCCVAKHCGHPPHSQSPHIGTISDMNRSIRCCCDPRMVDICTRLVYVWLCMTSREYCAGEISPRQALTMQNIHSMLLDVTKAHAVQCTAESLCV